MYDNYKLGNLMMINRCSWIIEKYKQKFFKKWTDAKSQIFRNISLLLSWFYPWSTLWVTVSVFQF